MASPPWTNVIDETKPADNDLASSLGSQGRQLKLDLRQRMAYQHIWGVDVNRDGAHINLILDDFGTIANKELLRGGGYSLTGSNAQAMVELSGTWNTSGTPTLCRYNINDTASNAAALLVDRQVGGVSKYKVDKAGNATFAGTVTATGGVNGAAIVQVKFASTNVRTDLTGSYADATGLVVSITPTRTANRIRIQASIHLDLRSIGFNALSTGAVDVRVMKSAVQVQEFANALQYGLNLIAGDGSKLAAPQCGANIYIDTFDSPASTSALTYGIQAKVSGATNLSGHVNYLAGGVSSTITVSEVTP